MHTTETKSNGTPKIGVYVCHCGVNISHTVDVSGAVEFARHLPHVTAAKEYKFMCSDPGQEIIHQDIRDGLVNRVVVASCSPLMHEPTFRNAMSNAGGNPFLFQMANIREHVSWVTHDKNAGTLKAKALIAAAVHRVALHQPLERSRVPVNPNVLVVGAGIAGIQAALLLAQAGKNVYLVEREPSIGGHMSRFDKTFPTLDCAACILTPKMVSVGQNPRIHLMTWAEVAYVEGYVGNFKVKIKKKPRYVDTETCISCGLCYEACLSRPYPKYRRMILGKQIIKEGKVLEMHQPDDTKLEQDLAAVIESQPEPEAVSATRKGDSR
ncbi:MAG: FAD-dependent oxidoreductase [Candidatus Zixiibacteriota bacterium]